MTRLISACINGFMSYIRNTSKVLICTDTCGILSMCFIIPQEDSNASDGRITYTRGCSPHSQNERSHHKREAQERRDTRLQIWRSYRSMEDQARRGTTLRRRERVPKQPRQIKNAGRCQQTNNVKAVRLLPLVVQTEDNNHQSRYLFVNYTWPIAPKATVLCKLASGGGWRCIL